MRKYFLIFIVTTFCIYATAAWAQETGQIVVPLSDEYIREWLLLGPFFSNSLSDALKTDFAKHLGGEANMEPKAGKIINTVGGTPLTWRQHKSRTDFIDLLYAIGNHKNAAAYAFCVLQSEVAGDARIYVGSDDGIAVWINGNQVHNHAAGRAFSPDRDMFKAHIKAGRNRCLVKVTQGTEAWGFSMRVDLSPPSYAIISGTVTDEAGRFIPNASVRVEQAGKEIAQTWTDDSGKYRISIHPARGSYDIAAREGERGNWHFGVPLREGQRRTLNLTLKKAVSIEGTLLTLDHETPHVAVVVQAVTIRRGKPVAVASALSDENGKYRLANLRSGRYLVRCYTLEGYIYYRWGKDKPVEMSQATPLRIEHGKTIRDIDFHFPPFKKGDWRTYTHLDGLTDNYVYDIYRDPDGFMWFATGGGGVSRYDGKEFTNFTMEDGLADNDVWTIYRDPDGVLWFGTGTWFTEGSGVSRYDGKEFVNFTTEDGLADNNVYDICCDPDGVMWFGTRGGVSRYDGKEFTDFTTKDGLVHNTVNAIHCDPDGVMWFGTGDWETGGGISKYDGKEFVNFTTENGLAHNNVFAIHRDPDGVMWFGTSSGVSRYDGQEFVNLSREDGLLNNWVNAIHRGPDGVMWFGTGGNSELFAKGGVSRYDGKGFVNFTTKDGLADSMVYAVYGDSDGVMWFGTFSGGVSRYDSSGVVNFTKGDGFGGRRVYAIHRDPEGVLWFGTPGSGVFRYDGKDFVKFGAKDGLASRFVYSIHGDPDGVIWFGTWGGVSCYDGKGVINLTEKDGLAHNSVTNIYADPDGVMWFGTWGGGVSRYIPPHSPLAKGGGKGEFVNFTTEDGLTSNDVFAIHRGPDGVMWFGTWGGGVSRYDGKEFVNFTTKDGLVSDDINAIRVAPDGAVWFGARGGLSCYDGRQFANFTTKDGLASNIVSDIYRDQDDVMWLATGGGGVCGYDGTVWTSLDTRDGLADDIAWSIHQDSDGSLWFATDEGVTRYRRSVKPPKAYIVSVTTDQTYRDLSAIPAFAIGTRVTIEYSAIDFKTVPEKRQYQCRVYETQDARHKTLDSPESKVSGLVYNPPTKDTSFDWTPEKSGTYTFEVRAIDRDLNYSAPASLPIVISAPLFYRTSAFLLALTIIGGGSLFGIIILGVQRWRSSHAERLRLQHELEDAHQMQIGLLPKGAPVLEGFDIAGFSQPAREVGGDFFDYLPLANGKIGIAIADVSGKGLKGAMNAVLANAVLRETAKNEASSGEILSSLNADLSPRMQKQMFTALGVAILGGNGKTLQWANAAQPYPIVKRGDRVFEFKSDGELPLGMIQDMAYPNWELDLKSGDVVIFYTDGIIEAENESEGMYGMERLEQTIKDMNSAMGAKKIGRAILQNVLDFTGAAKQYDDMTFVVVKKL